MEFSWGDFLAELVGGYAAEAGMGTRWDDGGNQSGYQTRCLTPWNAGADGSAAYLERGLTEFIRSGQVYCTICRNLTIWALNFPRY